MKNLLVCMALTNLVLLSVLVVAESGIEKKLNYFQSDYQFVRQFVVELDNPSVKSAQSYGYPYTPNFYVEKKLSEFLG